MFNKSFTVSALCLALLAPGAFAQDETAEGFPTPAESWWESCEAGWSATYEITQGEMGGITQTLTIDAIEGSMLTYTMVMSMGGNQMPPQTETKDAAEITDEMAPPEGATFTVIGEETVEVGGTSFDCTHYEITVEGQTMNVWHCAALPPTFMGGMVKIEAEANGMSQKIELTAYEGGLIE